jgi:hypothetical protein
LAEIALYTPAERSGAEREPGHLHSRIAKRNQIGGRLFCWCCRAYTGHARKHAGSDGCFQKITPG